MKAFYQMEQEEALRSLEARESGLTQAEATKRLAQYGENKLLEEKEKAVWQIFLSQFADFLVVILIAAALISMVSGNLESTIVIFVVIILNAILGTVQYVKARKSLESLKALSSPNARVLRDGKKREVAATEVVPGDILLLEAGDVVAADGRILSSFSLQVNESSLTGESASVDKNEKVLEGECPLADRLNLVYSGSLVTYGRAEVLVTGTGMNTEIGKIAGLMNETKEGKTPLQVSLDDFSKKLAIAIMFISALVFVLGLYRKMPILDSLLFAVALAVAAIPEALSSIVTIVQAIGTQKMVEQNAIIKDLKAVESLGSVSVICSDKTGTLTQNRMTVQQVFLDGKLYAPEQLSLSNPLHRYLLYGAVLSNDSTLREAEELNTAEPVKTRMFSTVPTKVGGLGDPTEYCLLVMARKAGVDENALRSMMQREEEIPFDSDRKLMSTKYRLHGKPTVLVKGALDELLKRSVSIAKESGVKVLSEQDKEELVRQNQQFSENGLRVLAFGYKEVSEDDSLSLENERDFTFLGLVSIVDPPRPESAAAVADAIRAGIRPIMITGDHKVTAAAIAKQIGIFREGDLAVTGSELDAMSKEELDAVLPKISVYARVSPENKIRIVEAWQKKGSVVAMTGDGVNDAPALKKADIGIAMGITGTEVSKDAASMILADDNFATIVKAVANGRNVYKNIRNAIQFLLSGNMAAILAVLYTSLVGLSVPFTPVHLLFINLLTDSLPAIAIGMEPAGKDLLKEAPRDPKEGILTKPFLTAILGQGALIAAATLFSYHVGLQESSALASTMAFATLAGARLFHGFNCRRKQSIFRLGFLSNPYTIAAFFLGYALLALALFVPFLQPLFSISPLDMRKAALVLGMAALPTILIQAYKLLNDKRE
ncbi:MAG: cation-translocating P-type ATPase [bacterium]|nr:cation-translocating P-type ATPase [bacterium]